SLARASRTYRLPSPDSTGASTVSARSMANGNTMATTVVPTGSETATASTAAITASSAYTTTASVRSRRGSASVDLRPPIGRPIGHTTTAAEVTNSVGLHNAPATALASSTRPRPRLAGPAPSQRAQKRVTLPGR